MPKKIKSLGCNKGETMKTKVAIVLSVAILSATSALAGSSSYQAGDYQLDPMHSKVGFEVDHLVIATVEGRFNKLEGKINLAADFTKSKANAEIDAASIDTGVADRDKHLRSADFFDVEKFPKLTLKNASFQGKPESFKLVGDLTIHGVTKKVSFDGKYLGSVKDAWGNEKIAFQAKTKINRKDFGLTWSKAVEVGPVVGDEITIDLRVQASKVK